MIFGLWTQGSNPVDGKVPVFSLLLMVLFAIVLGAFAFVWRVTHMPGATFSGDPAPLSASQQQLYERLSTHIEVLSTDIGERHVGRPEAYSRAADYIHETCSSIIAGVSAGRRGEVRRERFTFAAGESENIVCELKGTTQAADIVIVGAHYDTVVGSPGANDNASGVSVMLELARSMRQTALPRTLRFVAFANEELPHFGTQAMGSLRHLMAAEERGERIIAMLSLETLGVYSDAPQSQHYPKPFSFFYPSTGNFLGFVADLRSRDFLHQVLGAFRSVAQVPSEGVAAPRFINEVRRSDHYAFWQAGIPAIMVTDTANFRYRQYHTPADTAEIIDIDTLTRVVGGMVRVINVIGDGRPI